MRTYSMKPLSSSHFSLRFYSLLWIQCTAIQKLMSEINVRMEAAHSHGIVVQSWLGTSIPRFLFHCIIHHLHLPLGGPCWCDSY